MLQAFRWLGPLVGILIVSCSRGSVPLQPAGALPEPTVAPAAPSPEPSPVSVLPTDWVAFGDSITLQAFLGTTTWDAAFEAGAPRVYNAGFSGATALDALRMADLVLSEAPDGPVGLAFGTNDAYMGLGVATFKNATRGLIERARADGRVPMLATIPYSPHPRMGDLPAYNEAIRELAAELGVAMGPDLYAHFQAHPEQIQQDQIHVSREGNQAIQRLWAEALQGL